MLKTGSDIFVRFPDNPDERVLERGIVIGVGAGRISAVLESSVLPLYPGLELLLYYTREREFVQQPARVEGCSNEAVGLVIDCAMAGDPISAESRHHRRGTTILADIIAVLDGKQACRLQDVSMSGFAVVTEHVYPLGSVMPVGMNFEGCCFEGTARVQSVRELWRGHLRYGFRCVAGACSHELLRGLSEISAEIRRRQLGRLR